MYVGVNFFGIGFSFICDTFFEILLTSSNLFFLFGVLVFHILSYRLHFVIINIYCVCVFYVITLPHLGCFTTWVC